MDNIIVQLVTKKVMVENDINFDGKTTRIMSYITLETSDGIIIKDISVRQDIDNKSDIRVVYPFKKVHNSCSPYIEFSSSIVKKETTKMILQKVYQSISSEL